MKEKVAVDLYKKYYGGDKARHEIFAALAEWSSPDRVLYAGSFIHINASFVFPSVTYIDNDRNAKKFFKYHDDVISIITANKTYSQEPEVVFHGCSYEDKIPEKDENFDMLISLYAGFISKPCKKYLRKGGVLVVNNSHGDAGLASIDPDFEFIGVINGRGNKQKVSEKNLGEYFHPKKEIEVTEELLRKTGKGIGYTKTAPVYLFRKR